MSQIETIMLVALGFAVAALIALFLGRLTWVFALGLGKKRMQRATPTTIAELQADRDRLRAEYAMLSRKLELRMVDLKTKLAEQMAEVSRNRNRIDHLISEVRIRDALLNERDGELQALRLQLAPLESELTARTTGIQHLREQLRGRDEEIHKLTQTLEKLHIEVNERNHKIATMKRDIADREASGALLASDQLSAQERLKKRIADLTSLSSQIETQRRHLTQQKTAFESFKSEIGATTRQLPDVARSTTAPESSEAVSPSAGADALVNLDQNSRDLEQQLSAAERETAELESELKKLDESFNTKLAELNAGINTATKPPDAEHGTQLVAREVEAEANGTEPRPTVQGARPLRGMANVISLAARIRGQQKNAGE